MIKKIIMCSLLISASSLMGSMQSPEPNLMQKIKSALTNGTSYLLSSGDASEENTQYTHALLKKLDENHERPQVKKMNKLMEYLLGYKNTLSIPGLNHLYINEAWINTLPEEQKKFVIGRGLVWLKYGKSYLASQGLMSLMKGALLAINAKQYAQIYDSCKEALSENQAINEHMQAHNITEETIEQNPKLLLRLVSHQERIINLGIENSDNAAFMAGLVCLNSIINLLQINVNRSISYDADQKSIEQFDCRNGAKKVIRNLKKFDHDQSITGKTFSLIPVVYWASYLLHSSRFWPAAIALDLAGSYSGKLHNSPSKLGSLFKNLPLIHYFSRFPGYQSRIRAIKDNTNYNNISGIL